MPSPSHRTYNAGARDERNINLRKVRRLIKSGGTLQDMEAFIKSRWLRYDSKKGGVGR